MASFMPSMMPVMSVFTDAGEHPTGAHAGQIGGRAFADAGDDGAAFGDADLEARHAAPGARAGAR
jgi:hypothetical protein